MSEHGIHSDHPVVSGAIEVAFPYLSFASIEEIVGLLDPNQKSIIVGIVESHGQEILRILRQCGYPKVAIPLEAVDGVKRALISGGGSKIFEKLMLS